MRRGAPCCRPSPTRCVVGSRRCASSPRPTVLLHKPHPQNPPHKTPEPPPHPAPAQTRSSATSHPSSHLHTPPSYPAIAIAPLVCHPRRGPAVAVAVAVACPTVVILSEAKDPRICCCCCPCLSCLSSPQGTCFFYHPPSSLPVILNIRSAAKGQQTTPTEVAYQFHQIPILKFKRNKGDPQAAQVHQPPATHSFQRFCTQVPWNQYFGIHGHS